MSNDIFDYIISYYSLNALVIAKLNFTISDATVSSKIVNDLNVRLSSDINNKLSNG